MQWVVSLCRMYSMYPVLCSIWLVVTAGGHVVPTERQNSLSDVSLAATCSNWAPKWPRHITAGWTRYTDRPIPNSIPLPLVMTKYTHWPARNILLGNCLWNAKASYTRILNHDMQSLLCEYEIPQKMFKFIIIMNGISLRSLGYLLTTCEKAPPLSNQGELLGQTKKHQI